MRTPSTAEFQQLFSHALQNLVLLQVFHFLPLWKYAKPNTVAMVGRIFQYEPHKFISSWDQPTYLDVFVERLKLLFGNHRPCAPSGDARLVQEVCY